MIRNPRHTTLSSRRWQYDALCTDVLSKVWAYFDRCVAQLYLLSRIIHITSIASCTGCGEAFWNSADRQNHLGTVSDASRRFVRFYPTRVSCGVLDWLVSNSRVQEHKFMGAAKYSNENRQAEFRPSMPTNPQFGRVGDVLDWISYLTGFFFVLE